MDEKKITEDAKNYIKILLDRSFNTALRRSPDGNRFLVHLSEEIESELGLMIDTLLAREKKQMDYYRELIHFAKAIDFKGEMIEELKKRLNEKN